MQRVLVCEKGKHAVCKSQGEDVSLHAHSVAPKQSWLHEQGNVTRYLFKESEEEFILKLPAPEKQVDFKSPPLCPTALHF